MAYDTINNGIHARYSLPAGMVLMLAPLGVGSSARATSSVSGFGPWGPTSVGIEIGPLAQTVEIVVEVLAGTAVVDVMFPVEGNAQDIAAAAAAAAAAGQAAAAAAAVAGSAVQQAIAFSATTATATVAGVSFTPQSGTAPPVGFTTLTCTTNPGNFPAPIDGIPGMLLNDSLLWSGPLGSWTLYKNTLSSADLSDGQSLARAPFTVSGTYTVGQTLVIVMASGWSATSFQWSRNGVPISGATGSTYTIVPADAGSTVAPTVPTGGLSYSAAGGVVGGTPPVGNLYITRRIGTSAVYA